MRKRKAHLSRPPINDPNDVLIPFLHAYLELIGNGWDGKSDSRIARLSEVLSRAICRVIAGDCRFPTSSLLPYQWLIYFRHELLKAFYKTKKAPNLWLKEKKFEFWFKHFLWLSSLQMDRQAKKFMKRKLRIDLLFAVHRRLLLISSSEISPQYLLHSHLIRNIRNKIKLRIQQIKHSSFYSILLIKKWNLVNPNLEFSQSIEWSYWADNKTEQLGFYRGQSLCFH